MDLNDIHGPNFAVVTCHITTLVKFGPSSNGVQGIVIMGDFNINLL